jgi:hypothetical protein
MYNQIFGRDDEKLFQGDVYRLEGYYKGKFTWKDIPINSGAFDHIEHWDQLLGYSETGTWTNSLNISVKGSNPVMTTFENRNGRVKQHRLNDYGNNRIPASRKSIILIHDLEKPVLTKAAVRYVFHEKNAVDRGYRVYLLRFANKVQQAEFFDKMNFGSAPVIYVSSIHGKIKEWMKRSRTSTGSGSIGVRDPQTTRCFTPTNNKGAYGHIGTVDWNREEVDLREEEGYYVELQDGQAKVNGTCVYNLGSLIHHSNVLFTALGESVDKVYGIPDKNRNSKWFAAAEKDGQWTKLEDYFKSVGEQIIHGKGMLVAKASKYFNTKHDCKIGINFASAVLPLLKNKNGAMYKICSEITPKFRDASDFIEAMAFFNLKDLLSNECNTDFSSLSKEVVKAYPLLSHLEYEGRITSNDKSVSIPKDWLDAVVSYINLVDKSL